MSTSTKPITVAKYDRMMRTEPLARMTRSN